MFDKYVIFQYIWKSKIYGLLFWKCLKYKYKYEYFNKYNLTTKLCFPFEGFELYILQITSVSTHSPATNTVHMIYTMEKGSVPL